MHSYAWRHLMKNWHKQTYWVYWHLHPTHHWNNLTMTWDWEGLRKQTPEISYTHRSPLHLPTPISPHFCLLSFLSYEISFSLPFLFLPLISYCASCWNVHRARIAMECHCSVCWKALCSLSSSPLDISKGRKGLHGSVIKSLSLKETQKVEEWKGENPVTIFDSDSSTIHTTNQR